MQQVGDGGVGSTVDVLKGVHGELLVVRQVRHVHRHPVEETQAWINGSALRARAEL